jgi:hypothetical protein
MYRAIHAAIEENRIHRPISVTTPVGGALFTESVVLTCNREEDVTKTMYRETLLPGGAPALGLRKDVARGNKVNGICSAFIDNLSKKHLSKNIQNIITAHVCKSPPDHESALNLIATLKGMSIPDGSIYDADNTKGRSSMNKQSRIYVSYAMSISYMTRHWEYMILGLP